MTSPSRRILRHAYSNMLCRCHKPGSHKYEYYGGRGIAVCSEWRQSREAFFQWALTNGWQPKLELDRKDNDKGYSPENCQWITHQKNVAKRTVTERWRKASRANLLKVNRAYRTTRIKAACMKPVICLETGEIFPCAQDAADRIKRKRVTIHAAVNGHIQTAGGFRWAHV